MIREAKIFVRDMVEFSAARVGLTHSEERLAADSKAYWTGQVGSNEWLDNSHVREGSAFGSVDWRAIGDDHWLLFSRLARVADFDGSLDRVVEWGCGGGTNAVAFAPHCSTEFVGVDIVPESLTACAEQVGMATDVKFTGVLADVAQPEAAAAQIATCDLFTSFYVLELVPSPEYGLRVMRIGRDLLKVGGLAFVQIKYSTGHWRTRSRRRGYRASVLGSMTTYAIHEFWIAMTQIGLPPEAVYLVPSNELDGRYAYFLLRKV